MNWKRTLPSGTKDKLFRQARGIFEMEQEVSEVFFSRGYQRVETPSFEFEEVFQIENANERALYRFFDHKNRLLALRPDMTLPIGRVVATTNIVPPVHLSYSGKVFRSNDEMTGEQNEQTQAGIEIIGFDSLKAELECIVCTKAVLKKLEITDFHIEMGHAQIYQEIVRELALSEKDEVEFKQFVLNKSITDLKNFVRKHPSSLDEFLIALPKLFGEVEPIIKQAKAKVDNPIIVAAFDQLLALNNAAREYDNSLSLTVDLGLVQSFQYYSGIIIRGFADLLPDYFLSGGRYNSLLEQFGSKPLPAVGIAFNLDTLADLKQKLGIFYKEQNLKTFIHFDKYQMKKAEELQKKTPFSKLSLFDSLEKSREFAQKWQYETLLVVKSKTVEQIMLKE